MFMEYEEGDNKVVNNIIYCDYEDCSFLKSVVERSCNIIYTATYIPESITDDNKELEIINSKLADFKIEVFSNKEVNRFFNLSGINIYGYGQKELIDVSEDGDILLANYYAKSKYKSEILFSHCFERNYNLRISSPFGRDKRKKALLEMIVEKILNHEEINIYGEGKRTQDFI